MGPYQHILHTHIGKIVFYSSTITSSIPSIKQIEMIWRIHLSSIPYIQKVNIVEPLCFVLFDSQICPLCLETASELPNATFHFLKFYHFFRIQFKHQLLSKTSPNLNPPPTPQNTQIPSFPPMAFLYHS